MIPSDFGQFMREVHGHPPFPWQSGVVEEVLRRGTWPGLVDAPTGLGKTAMLDVAVFILALGAGGDAPPGLGRRRIYFVVDRRIVVDQAERHARRIADALRTAPADTISFEVARRLRSLTKAPVDDVIGVTKMRGGTTWDAAWLPRPDLPGIVTGTVDQVGSRVFFRGYGVSAKRRPIDAALVGTDSLIMIDEAHLARALASSLAKAQALDSGQAASLPGSSVVHLSATSSGQPMGWVTSFDEEAHLANPTAQARLQASKRLRLTGSNSKAMVKCLTGEAIGLAQGEGSRVLIVCNTVDRARDVHAHLGKELPEVESILLIGRSRQADREATAARVTELFGADRTDTRGRAVLVATQTVEVGIDLDATALVTETASWDALVQRIGRVNRRGSFGSAQVVVVDEETSKPAVYGPTQTKTAEFLRLGLGDQEDLDVSPLALRRLETAPELMAPSPPIPAVFPAQLDAWARTSPAPTADPPVAPYLHGVDTSLAPITLAWRAGLVDDEGTALPAAEAGASIEALPLHAQECIEVPIGAVRRWLLQRSPQPLGDLDLWDDEDVPFGEDTGGPVLLRATEDAAGLHWEWIEASSVRPGDVLISPCGQGGLDRFGWSPASAEPVLDVAEWAALRRGNPALRLDPGLGQRLGVESPDGLWELVRQWRNAEDPDDRSELLTCIVTQVQQWLQRPIGTDSRTPWTEEDRALLSDAFSDATVLRLLDGAPPVLSVQSKRSWLGVEEHGVGTSSHLLKPVTLSDHLAAVAQRASDIVDALGLVEPLRRTIVDAARWHDLGKVEPRFQAMLFGGSAILAELAEEPLAKSGMACGDAQAHSRARRSSKLPRGARHEAWSEALIKEYLASVGPYPGDPELLCHLVASHHGHARPFLPPILDRAEHGLVAEVNGRAVKAALPIGVNVCDADRFAVLNERYGRWGLALLESIVRCADMTVSSEGS